MKRNARVAVLLIVACIAAPSIEAQSKNKPAQLPAAAGSEPAYYTEVNNAYTLTDEEKRILNSSKYVISTGRNFNSHAALYNELKNKDLPVYITVDSIQYAFHMSFQRILNEIEAAYLYDRLYAVISGVRNMLPSKAGAVPAENLGDMDLYASTLLRLLTGEKVPSVLADESVTRRIDELGEIIDRGEITELELFGARHRIDFGLFRPRAHYAKYECMKRYYKTIVGLSCLSFHMIDRTGAVNARNVRDAWLLTSLMKEVRAEIPYREFRRVMEYLVGSPDFISPFEIEKAQGAVRDISSNDDAGRAVAYLKAAFPGSNAVDEEIRYDGEPAPYGFAAFDRISPADSRALNNIIFDRIKADRHFPKGLDIAYLLGNGAAAPFLEAEFKKYSYREALDAEAAAVAKLDGAYWDRSLYNNWLAMIRDMYQPELKANPNVPGMFKMDSWNKKVLNSQLSSWTLLRHDTQAYVKEPTPGAGCENVDAYLDPCVKVYERLERMSVLGQSMFSEIDPAFAVITSGIQDSGRAKDLTGMNLEDFTDIRKNISGYYAELRRISGMLRIIASRELNGQSLDTHEFDFLRGVIQDVERGEYSPQLWDGWYIKMFYRPEVEFGGNTYMDFYPSIVSISRNTLQPDPGILHAATGSIKMAFFLLDYDDASKGARLFCGPVSSYYEFVYPGDRRLDDPDWVTTITGQEHYDPDGSGASRGIVLKKEDVLNYIRKNSGNDFLRGVKTSGDDL
jgi:hypothetical protein